MNDDQELEQINDRIYSVGNKMMRAFVEGVTEIEEELFNKYSAYFHVGLLSSINFSLMNGIAQTATEAGTDKIANPDEVFQYMMKEVMEETIKSYFIKRQITKEGVH